MDRSRFALILAAGVFAAAFAVAQPVPSKSPAADPKPASEPATPDPSSPAAEKPADDASSLKPEFPKVVKKRLYARNDLRGKPAPAIKVEKWLTTQPKREGKVVLIDFWATWCDPCRKLIVELEAFKQKFGDDLIVIGVSDEDEKTVRDYIKGRSDKVTYSMAVDTQGVMKKAIGVENIPHVLVIDSRGIVRWQGFPQSGEDRLTESVLRQIIDADKAARPTKTAAPKPSPATPPAPAPAAKPPTAPGR